ncbi:MAG: hypothetical protein KDC45_14370 [Bacteroidetes bacterium]|nr:hypothetical protein [Bacteroidota bacterium]
MQTFLLWIVVLPPPRLDASGLKQTYTIDLTHTAEDRFYVTLDIEGITEDSIVFQFAVTAPGVYEILDPGRFIQDFSALAKNGRRLTTRQININQFVIYDSRRLASLTYRVDDSSDTLLVDHPVNPMCGSNLEPTNAVINNQMVMGYFHGHQADPINVKMIAPQNWKIGTALRRGRGGIFRAGSFDELVDSPFLAGELSQLSLKIDSTFIDLYVYSESKVFDASMLEKPLKKILLAARDFIGSLPVDRYTFLFHYRQDTGPIFGAWEHHLSSLYVLPEWAPDYMLTVTSSMAAHEFFHIISPLHIHSNLIEPFNFETPTPSRHLWLYEGVTEWASDMMQVRAGLINDSTYLTRMRLKIKRAADFRTDLSLVDISLGSYDAYSDQYGNIYEKGALTAMMLDLRLLDLTNGEIGLREVILKLLHRYGRTKPFDDEDFFKVFAEESDPAIADFFERYVAGTDPLPYSDYLAQAGYEYIEKLNTGRKETTAGRFTFDFSDDRVVVTSIDSSDSVCTRLGILPGDTLLQMKIGESVLDIMDPGIFEAITILPAGFYFTWLINRDGRKLSLSAFTGEREVIQQFVIRPIPSPSTSQLDFRQRWLGRSR